MKTLTCEEARGFAEAMKLMSNGMRGIPGMFYYRQMFAKASEVIFHLCDELSTGTDQIKNEKEKIEGEKEKRDLPPTPPIESKAKEGEEKKDHLHSACACAREEAMRINNEADEVFFTFWTKYPVGHKIGKAKCRKKMRLMYRAAKDKAKFINDVLGGLDRWFSSRRWAEGYICNPYTWLHQERWLDVPEVSKEARREEAEVLREQSNAESAEDLRKLGL